MQQMIYASFCANNQVANLQRIYYDGDETMGCFGRGQTILKYNYIR
jgi:hypothetical protein